jgi:hypothetical protein
LLGDVVGYTERTLDSGLGDDVLVQIYKNLNVF